MDIHVFSTINLVKAYKQISVNPEAIAKIAIANSFGLFEISYMTFGLRKTEQAFQSGFIDEVLGLDFCFPYVNYILLFSRSVG